MNRKKLEDSARLLVASVSVEDIVSEHLHILGKKNVFAYNHCENVAFIAAQCMLLWKTEEERAKQIIAGALLHDIGKIYVPDYILDKPGKLTSSEWEIVKMHPKRGYDLIKDSPLSDITKDIVLHHHENNVGTGYPDGTYIMSDETKLISIIDKYDAITEYRPYRKNMLSLYDAFLQMEQIKPMYQDVEKIYATIYKCKGI